MASTPELPRWQSPARQQQIESEFKMSNALKNAVETGATTLSELVDDARSLIEDLPPMANRKRSRRNWSSVFVVVLLAFVATIAARQLRHQPSEAMAESNNL